MTTERSWLLATAGAALVGAIAVAAGLVVLLPALLAVAVIVVVCARDWSRLPPVLLVVALPFVRPGLLSNHYNAVGLGIALAAALIAVARRGRVSWPRPFSVVLGALVLAYVWLLIRTGLLDHGSPNLVAQGAITTIGATLAYGIVLADRTALRTFGRGFVGLVIAICASYVISAAVWIVAGSGVTALVSFPISDDGWVATLHLPFTITTGVQSLGFITLPRLTGLGREPGWFAMMVAIAWFLWPTVGRPRLIGHVLLFIGLVGTVSTAGFGIFILLLSYDLFVRPRTVRVGPRTIARVTIGLVGMAAAAWVAFFAPVLGFAEKSQYNEVSFDDRALQTAAGVHALSAAPLGGVHIGGNEAINLIAAIAPFGLPYVLLVLTAVIGPLLASGNLPNRSRALTIMGAVALTLFTSQPPGDSALAYVLVAVGACLYAVAPAEATIGRRRVRSRREVLAL
jgi:hypothetical protein